MDSINNLIPLISQLVGGLTARDTNRRSNAEMEVMVRSAVNECLQQQAAMERKEMVSGLLEVVKESVARPQETRRDPEVEDLLKKFKQLSAGKETQRPDRDEERTKQMIMEVLKEMLADKQSGQDSSQGRARDSSGNIGMVLPWCDGPDSDSKSKSTGKEKQFSERKGSVNDGRNTNFKDKGDFEKKSFDSQHKNFNRGRGGFQRGNNFPHDGTRRDNRPGAAAAGPVNVPQARHDQHWPQEGAVGYTRSDVPQYRQPYDNHMHQQHGAPPPPPPASGHQPGPPNYQSFPGNNYHHSGLPNYNHQFGRPNYSHQPGGPGPANQNGGPPMQQFGNNGPQPLFPQPPPNIPHYRNNQHPFRPADANYGGNMNHGNAERNFSPRGNNTRGRGGYQRGGYNNRGGRGGRTDYKGNTFDFDNSLTDLTSLSPKDVTTIKNALQSEASGIQSKKTSQNKVAFKPKKNNVHGKPCAENSDDQEEEKSNNLSVSTNENKVIVDKLPGEAASTGAKKKKKNTNKNVNPDEDQKPKEAATNDTAAAASENVKLLVGLGLNKEVLSNVNENQEVKHVVLIARCGDETKTFQPRTVGEFKDFKKKYPKAEAIIVKKE